MTVIGVESLVGKRVRRAHHTIFAPDLPGVVRSEWTNEHGRWVQVGQTVFPRWKVVVL